MLVLSRKIGETILVGDDVVITVTRIGPNSVRIGVAAPNAKRIVRGELVEGIEHTELPQRIRDKMESILEGKELVEELPVNGSSQDGDRMDCEGHDAPFYSEKSILNGIPINVYAINDCDWYAGATLEECIAKAVRDNGCRQDEIVDDPRRLSNEELDKLTFRDDDGSTRSFSAELKRLQAKQCQFPRLLASTEC